MRNNLSESILNELKIERPNLEYRRSEFNKIPLNDGGYKLKITSNNGETKWLDITEKELAKIEKLLTK